MSSLENQTHNLGSLCGKRIARRAAPRGKIALRAVESRLTRGSAQRFQSAVIRGTAFGIELPVKRPGTILFVEDDPGAAESLQHVLEDEGYTVIAARTGEEGLALAVKERRDLVLTDLKLPGLSGLDLVKRLHTARTRLPIILMTAHGTTEVAIEATRHGAFDYLLKPFEMPTMLRAVQKALAASRLMFHPVEIGKVVAGRDAIIGNSRAMQETYKEIGRVAATPVTVLIRGETGTGKELIARAIYQQPQ